MDPGDQYLAMRLHRAHRAVGLPVSARIDLALSPLSDAHLDRAVSQFGGPDFTRGPSGWGIGDLLHHQLTQEPDMVATRHLSTLQQNLINHGYLPPGTPTDGIWNAENAAALGRFDYDNQQLQLAGKHPGAAPLAAGIRLIGNVLPAEVWNGVVGTARGLVKQAPETAERLGLTGGAAAGAAIGTAIEPGLGTIIGGVAGGAIGFISSMLHHDDADKPHGNLWNALLPYEEYAGKNGFHKFMTDLGFVATAASMLYGTGDFGVATAAGLRGIASSGLREALTTTTALERPTYVTSILSKAMPKGVRAGFVDVASRYGPAALRAGNPVLRTATEAYTGFSSAQLSARYLGGLGSGKRTTKLEAAIEDSPYQIHGSAKTWLDLTAGNILAPTKFFAFGLGDAAQGIRGVLGEEPTWPLRMSLDPTLSRSQQKQQIDEALSTDPAERMTRMAMLYLTHGRAREMGAAGDVAQTARERWEARFKTANDLNREVLNFFDKGDEAARPTVERLMSYSFHSPTDHTKGPESFAAFLTNDLDAHGSGIDRLTNHVVGMKNVERLQEAWRANPSLLNVEGERPHLTLGLVDRPEEGIYGTPSEQDFHRAAASIYGYSDTVRSADKRLKKAQNLDPVAAQSILQERMQAQEGLNDLADNLRRKGMLSSSNVDRLYNSATDKKAMQKVITELGEMAPMFPSEVQGVPQDFADQFDQAGYRVLATNAPQLHYSTLRKRIDELGLDEWARNPNIWDGLRYYALETAGLDPIVRPDAGLSALRHANSVRELNQVAIENKVKLTPSEILQRLNAVKDDLNRPFDRNRVGEASGHLGPVVLVNTEGGKRTLRYFKTDLRELSESDIIRALNLTSDRIYDGQRDVFDLASQFRQALRRGASLGGQVDLRNPMDSIRALGQNLRVSGAQGFSDWLRTWNYADPRRFYGLAGAAAGAEIAREKGESPEGVAEGALLGGAAGFAFGQFRAARRGVKVAKELGAASIPSKYVNDRGTFEQMVRHWRFPQGSYGYLPDQLHRLNMALRFSLSLMFDLGRYSEQMMLSGEHGLPLGVAVGPERYIEAHYGPGEWQNAIATMDRIEGGDKYRLFDDIDKRYSAEGLLGFSPAKQRAGAAYILHKRGMPDHEIYEAVHRLTGYGVGRSAGEKSINFVFFPFSFQKKVVAALGDWILQAPARALLIHEGLRRYHASSADEKVNDFINKRLPFLQKLQFVNNLSYGISPGRFFLQGLESTHNVLKGQETEYGRTPLGKAAFLIGSMLAPGGVATPLASAFGGAGDAAIHAFIPLVITDSTPPHEVEQILQNYIPLTRELGQLGEGASEQYTALTEGGGAPYYQLQSYLDEKRRVDSRYDNLAQAFGYASGDSFLASDVGRSIKPQYDAQVAGLKDKYPTGFRMSTSFTNTTAVNAQMLYDLASKPHRSPAEDLIIRLAEIEDNSKQVADLMGVDHNTALLMTQQQIRKVALKHLKTPGFADLYDRFFSPIYGPIRRVA